jgi:hypothetical protein
MQHALSNNQRQGRGDSVPQGYRMARCSKRSTTDGVAACLKCVCTPTNPERMGLLAMATCARKSMQNVNGDQNWWVAVVSSGTMVASWHQFFAWLSSVSCSEASGLTTPQYTRAR